MIVYIGMTVLSLVLAPICSQKFKWSESKRFKGKNAYLSLMALICILCMGLRNQSVGYDTELYVRIFLRIGAYPDLLTALSRESNSIPAYVLLCRIVYQVSTDPQFHIFVEAVLINVGLFIFIKKASVEYSLSTFLYFGLALMYFAMNGARQTIAMVFCANAIIILTKNLKNIKGWLWLVLAVGIHMTSLISVGLIAGIMVYNKRMDKKIVTCIFAAVGAFTGSALLVLSSVFSGYFTHYEIYFNGRASYDLRGTEGGGRIVIIYIYLAMFVIIWLFQKVNKDKTEYDEMFLRLVPGIAFGITLGIVNSRNVLINRMVWYYIIFFIPFIPYVIGRCSKNRKMILTVGTVVVFFVYSILFMRENQGAIVPYHLFWN